MSARHAAVARTARAQAGRDIHKALLKLATLEHTAGNSAAYMATTAAASLAIRLTIEHETDKCS